MARLTATEFEELVRVLASAEGLGRLQDKLLRTHALVSRRRLGSPEALARLLNQLTAGLEREHYVTRVVLALWEEEIGTKLEEAPAKELEAIAEEINGCLNDAREVAASREPDLRVALDRYRRLLAERIGESAARLTMIMRAYPSVARVVRELPAESATP
jgi:hypothetical protein